MYTDMSVESGKKIFIVNKWLRAVPIQGMVEQAKTHGGFRPQRGYRGNALRPRDQGGRGLSDEGYN